MRAQKLLKIDREQCLESEVVRAILECPGVILPDLKPDEMQVRTHDDHDGTYDGKIHITQDRMGDIWILLEKYDAMNRTLRFRNGMGGTNSPRVHNALKILAEAIRLDNIYRPEPKAGHA